VLGDISNPDMDEISKLSLSSVLFIVPRKPANSTATPSTAAPVSYQKYRILIAICVLLLCLGCALGLFKCAQRLEKNSIGNEKFICAALVSNVI